MSLPGYGVVVNEARHFICIVHTRAMMNDYCIYLGTTTAVVVSHSLKPCSGARLIRTLRVGS